MAPALVAVGVVCLVLAGCAHQPPPPEEGGAPGFFTGLWNGFTIAFSLIVSLFGHVRIYAFPNSGWGYDFGFCIGVGSWGGATSAIGRAVLAEFAKYA